MIVSVNENSNFLTSSPCFGILGLLNFGLSDRSIMISHLFYFIFFITSVFEYFSWAYLPCICLFFVTLFIVCMISKCVDCPFFFPSSVFEEQISNLMSLNFSTLFLLSYLRNHCLIHGNKYFLLCFLDL